MNHFGEIPSAEPAQAAAPPYNPGSSTERSALDEQLRIHEYERRRMGQELHDCAGQLLVSLQLSIAHLALAREHEEHDSVLHEIHETVSQIDREIRALAFLDYPAELGGRGLCGAVKSLVAGFSRRTGVHATFKCVGDQSGLAEPVATAVLRVVQEALVNIHRHAHASSARVVVEHRHDELRVSIGDNGVGMKVSRASPGIGLQGMRHRIESIGGSFRIANLTRGTRISASVPLAA